MYKRKCFKKNEIKENDTVDDDYGDGDAYSCSSQGTSVLNAILCTFRD
jgi:hypothetical protein